MTTSNALVDSGIASDADPTLEREDCLIQEAITLLEQRIFQRGPKIQSARDLRQYLRLRLVAQADMFFGVVFLDAGHRVLAFELASHGTIDRAPVYPREVLKRVLFHSATAVILTHNNPSGCCQASAEDRAITQRLKQVLALVDVRVLDHLVIGEGEPFSFAEAGLL